MSQYVLGLDINDFNTSAAVALKGRLIAAAQEERFNREKRTRRFPIRAAEFCLSKAGIGWKDLEIAAISVNPAIYLEDAAFGYSERARYRGELLYAPVNLLLSQRGGGRVQALELELVQKDLGELRIHYITHHDSHAATAFYLSPFDSCAILSIDGYGEKETTVMYDARGTAIQRLHSVPFPHSVGSFYSVMTSFLGLVPDRHEWKLMAAAASGDSKVYLEKIREMIRYTGHGSFEVDLSYFNYYITYPQGYFTRKLLDSIGEPYPRESEPDQRFFDIAAAVQQVTEEVVFELLRDLAQRVQSPNLCLTGGLAMNCVINGQVPLNTPFQNVFVPPMPDDGGTSIGAALHTAVSVLGAERPDPIVHNYLGPEFSDSQIEEELKRNGLSYWRSEDPAAEAARMIADGRLIGWFQGAMEFGDRALGNRSILADPRQPDMPGRINRFIKDRRLYQPYAPSILAERADDFFLQASESPFMEKTFGIKPEKAHLIPAVLAKNGTARVQTVTAAQNPMFRSLIEHFDRITGCPMVLNTSFNLRGEPIVCSIRDALRTFYSSGLDALFVGPFALRKAEP